MVLKGYSPPQSLAAPCRPLPTPQSPRVSYSPSPSLAVTHSPPRSPIIPALHLLPSSPHPSYYCLRLPGPSSFVITAVFRFCRRERDILRRPVRSRALGSPSSGPCRSPGPLRTLNIY
ncbi:hypothetical protein L873DRAFT_446198 [Choiromyces venosus 120613-1]|uniref:Uncharacterized protein n=1 Tax=Choiromyces venosus 120613-1 TaxID=1336337 RepID=A0A3N4JV62_9PEZI|nr:hypothetical protein L873DRAFT_446198 [Choiromyces venosus 120613-1]